MAAQICAVLVILGAEEHFARDDRAVNFWGALCDAGILYRGLRATALRGAKEASKKLSERRDIDRSSTRWAWKSGYPGEVFATRVVAGGTRFRNRAA